jgi:hypothetical protein
LEAAESDVLSQFFAIVVVLRISTFSSLAAGDAFLFVEVNGRFSSCHAHQSAIQKHVFILNLFHWNFKAELAKRFRSPAIFDFNTRFSAAIYPGERGGTHLFQRAFHSFSRPAAGGFGDGCFPVLDSFGALRQTESKGVRATGRRRVPMQSKAIKPRRRWRFLLSMAVSFTQRS